MPRFLRFTDRDGRAWRVYEFSITAGRVTYFSPGKKGGAQYKGFVPEPRDDGRPRRRFMMLTHLRPEDRRTDPETLQLQLDLSEADRRDSGQE
jgi:hypothetical protein